MSSSTQNTSQRAEASFSGQNGRISVGGDIVEVRNGNVSVNGIPHGQASPKSQIRYVVQGQGQGRKAQLFIDGVERPPSR
jgi:hypothetical protein